MPQPLDREDLQHVLDNTRDLWEELRGNRVFLTGGTGFFGVWLLETFSYANDKLRLGARAVCLTRDQSAFRRKAPHLAASPAISFVRGDVRDFPFPSGEFSHLIHAATTSSAPVTHLETLDTIIIGTRRALDLAATCGAKKILLTSSGAVYGTQPPDMTHIPETFAGTLDVTNPASAYGEGKRIAELLCELYRIEHGIEPRIARCFAFVGPHLPLDAHFAIGNFIGDGLKGEPIRVKGDGTARRSYLYAADLAIWLWTILMRGRPCWPYNVGSETDLSIGQLAGLVAESFKPMQRVVIERSPTPGTPVERYVPATRRTQAELGLIQQVDLKAAIEKTIAWYQTDMRRA
jgi:nucleoside-diphosphate-sugar epimerase